MSVIVTNRPWEQQERGAQEGPGQPREPRGRRRRLRQGCQMAIAGFLESYVFGPLGLKDYGSASLQTPTRSNPRKGRAQILPSGNLGEEATLVKVAVGGRLGVVIIAGETHHSRRR